MSDLHKAFLRKIREKEATLGLGLLADEGTNGLPKEANIFSLKDHTEENIGLGLRQNRKLGISNINNNNNGNNCKGKAEDIEIISRYKEVQESFFEHEIIYKNNRQFKIYQRIAKNPKVLLFCHHGAGSSSMTFAQLAQYITKGKNDKNHFNSSTNANNKDENNDEDDTISLFLFDMRGHGDSLPQIDYSLESLVLDARELLEEALVRTNFQSVFLLGHSLGGAVLAKLARSFPNADFIKGLVLLDIVEETAVTSLNNMPKFLDRIPPSFPSISMAVDWHLQSLLHNKDSAKISVPDLLHLDSLTWKADLKSTAPFWQTWFLNLSQNFLDFSGAKLLILSTHETLDKPLMIGQMQGKYQLVVFGHKSDVGHFVHEDVPQQVATCIIDYIRKTVEPEKFMAQEMGFVPKWGGNINQ